MNPGNDGNNQIIVPATKYIKGVIPVQEAELQFIFVSFRSEARNLDLNKFSVLR